MVEKAFHDFVMELCFYYERKEPREQALDLWFTEVKHIPDEPLDWMRAQIGSRHESFPKNLPVVMRELWHLTASTLYKLGFVIADIQSVLRHQSATTTAKYIKSLGREGLRTALEALFQQKGNVLIFKPREINEGENPPQKEKAVSGAVYS